MDRNTNIFQPPKSPASAIPSPNFATSNDYFSHRSRKRQRPDSPHAQQQTPWTATPGWVQCPTPSDGMYGSGHAQSSAMVNERYRLAGGLDTPGLMEEQMYGRQGGDGELESRRRLRDQDSVQQSYRDDAQLSGPLARERNGFGRTLPNGDQHRPGWTGIAFGLVGKVFSLGSTVIRGFYAGGGKGYDLQQQPLSDSWMYSARAPEGCGTPVPGSWQEDEFLGDFEQDNLRSPSITSMRPPNKRRQTDKDNWVVVGTPDVSDLSPRRKPTSDSVPRSALAAARPTASRANSRRSLAPVSRRQSTYVTQTGSPAQALQALEVPSKRASVVNMRIPKSRPSSAGGAIKVAGSPTYITPEAERFVKKQAKQDKAADKAIGSMSRRLEDLIRQGQEALGTKFEVEGEAGDVDEGFVDEEW